MTPRTYLYKLTSDRGGAPCAIAPAAGEDARLTLAICKPAIRRTAQPGDRILGITSHALAHTDGYPLLSVIYAAVVEQAVQARDYFDSTAAFAERPDCIYRFHQQNGRAAHAGLSRLHRTEAHLLKDLGTYPYYRNGRVLVCRDFRYLGAQAMPIPARLPLLLAAAETLGQGHRVYTPQDPEGRELDSLFRHLWKRPTRYTPAQVEVEVYDRRGPESHPTSSAGHPTSSTGHRTSSAGRAPSAQPSCAASSALSPTSSKASARRNRPC